MTKQTVNIEMTSDKKKGKYISQQIFIKSECPNYPTSPYLLSKIKNPQKSQATVISQTAFSDTHEASHDYFRLMRQK